ncbi:MAG: alginate export family protein [Acidobacteria bacterium]|nr:alginate export family protein [Acidobacteriota bacterium]
MALSRGRRAVVSLGIAGLAACGCLASAQAQTIPDGPASSGPSLTAAGATGETSFLVENVTRAEVWRYFEPPPKGGTHPDYTFFGNRATLGVSYDGARWSTRGTLQYVRLENLPAGAIGPGLLGTGGAYFFQAGGTFSYQFYLRSLSLMWRERSRGVWIEAGRLSRAASLEAPSGDATIDRLVAEELNGRLLGDMEWSFYQRAWDGVRGGVMRGTASATLTAVMPTQGTFEESANLTMDRVRVAAAEVTLAPGTVAPRTRVEAFGMVYDDTRPVSARPDNTGIEPDRAAVRVWTLGASAAGAYPSRWGTSDAVAWIAAQTGAWYELSHRAVAATLTGGHRFTRAPWRPWLRAGMAYASGDGSVSDLRHGTFFPMLPSSDRVSRLNAYAFMNVVDRWAVVEVQPHPALEVSTGVRRVGLASERDRWYQGSGATLRGGNYFGFQGRDGRGGDTIGTVVEGAATWQPRSWWTLRAHAGRIVGGDVVSRLFRGRRLVNGWLESTVRF